MPQERDGTRPDPCPCPCTPVGDFAVVLIEAADLSTAMLGLATSQEAFDVWFRDHLRTVHGLDLAQGMALPEQILDVLG